MKNKYKINIFITIIIICLVLSIIVLNILSKKVLPTFMNYAVSEVKNIATIIVNRSINNNINELGNDILNVTKNTKDEIQIIDCNHKEANKLLLSATRDILKDLKSLETGNEDIKFEKINYKNGVVYEVPIGIATDNIFFGNLGPKIPIKLQIIGDIDSNIKTEVKEYGINNAFVEVFICINISIKVIMPFISEDVKITSDVPISIKLIHGSIPEYYGGLFSKKSSILSIPSE